MSLDFYSRLGEKLENLKREGTYKKYRYLTSPMRGRTGIEGQDKVIVLCSNNYLGIADKEEVVKRGMEALEKYGAGAASVRFICGTYDIHRDLEEKIASFLGTEAALTYSSCWSANTAVIPALLEPGDTVISDELNHASIIDGCRLVSKGVNRAVYKHSDMESLEEKLKQHQDSNTTLVVTDGVFSMEGDIALLPQILELIRKYNAILMVDDSHATGVLGKTGRGTAEYYGLHGEVDIITGTFGKALGGAGGGFVAARKSVIDICIQRSRPHLFSNSLPPVLAGIALGALEYLEGHPEIVASLKAKVEYFRNKLQAANIDVLSGDSAIIPIMIYDTAKAIKMADEMLQEGLYVTGFGYPVVPKGQARIRLQVSDALSYEDIDEAIGIIKKVIEKNR